MTNNIETNNIDTTTETRTNTETTAETDKRVEIDPSMLGFDGDERDMVRLAALLAAHGYPAVITPEAEVTTVVGTPAGVPADVWEAVSDALRRPRVGSDDEGEGEGEVYHLYSAGTPFGPTDEEILADILTSMGVPTVATAYPSLPMPPQDALERATGMLQRALESLESPNLWHIPIEVEHVGLDEGVIMTDNGMTVIGMDVWIYIRPVIPPEWEEVVVRALATMPARAGEVADAEIKVAVEPEAMRNSTLRDIDVMIGGGLLQRIARAIRPAVATAIRNEIIKREES